MSCLGPHDGVTCFYCGNTLTDWLETLRSTYKEIVPLEHARFFPCRFVHYTTSMKFIADATHSHPVSEQGNASHHVNSAPDNRSFRAWNTKSNDICGHHTGNQTAFETAISGGMSVHVRAVARRGAYIRQRSSGSRFLLFGWSDESEMLCMWSGNKYLEVWHDSDGYASTT